MSDIAELRRAWEEARPYQSDRDKWAEDNADALLDRVEAAEAVATKLESMVEFGDMIEEFDDMLALAAQLRGKEDR